MLLGVGKKVNNSLVHLTPGIDKLNVPIGKRSTMHYAIGATSVAVATLFTNCAPFFVGVLGLFGLTARPAPPFWKALPVALIGVALLIGVSGNAGMGTLAGDALALVAAALYAAYLVSVKALRDRGAICRCLQVHWFC